MDNPFETIGERLDSMEKMMSEIYSLLREPSVNNNDE